MKNLKKAYLKMLGLGLLFVMSASIILPAGAQSNNSSAGSNSIEYLSIVFSGSSSQTTTGGVYYLSPTGNDNASGTTETQAWATFDRAINADTGGNKLQPGDTLILLDGIYRQSLTPNGVSGQTGKLITIRAKNDGKVIIDGEKVRIPVDLKGDNQSSYYDIEGIIARNSSGSVFDINTDNNILRRVSGYNANTDENEHVFVIWANNNLLEDCVAAGSGRKMILIYSGKDPQGQHNTVRRCFASYREQDERDWSDEWPWNENFEAYSADYNTFENDIAYGYYANAGFSFLAQGGGDTNQGNKVLGSLAIMGDYDFQGNPIHWGDIRPQPTDNTYIKNLNEPCERVGIFMGHGSTSIIKDNLIQDVLSWGNASVGLCVAESPQMINNVLNRVTITNNGLDLSAYDHSVDMRQDDLSGLTITNSRINIFKPAGQSKTGEGARLQNRYIDGVLKDGSDGTPAQALWPWPMEDRIRNELGISVTNLVSSITRQASLANPVSPMSDTANKFPGSYLSVTPVMLPFGSIKSGSSTTLPVTLKNLGNTALSVTNYQFERQSANVFSIASGGTCPQIPFNLAPAQSCTVKISFAPANNNPQSAHLDFISPQNPPFPGPTNTYLSGAGGGAVILTPIEIFISLLLKISSSR